MARLSIRGSFFRQPMVRFLFALVLVLAWLPQFHQTEAVVNGDAVTIEEQHALGLVTVVGLCSGVLLVNDWALTAGHCVAPNRTQPSNVVFSMRGIAPDPDTTATADAIYLFGGYSDEIGPDLALVHLSTPFVIDGASSGFANQLWPGSPDSLINPNVTVTAYGQGVTSCPIPPATTAPGAGTYRVAELSLSGINFSASERPINLLPTPTTFFTQEGGNYYELIANSKNQILAPGDSGGPGFIWSDGIPYLVGIQSGSNCLGGDAHQVSIPTVRDWIYAVLHTQWTPGISSQPVWVLPTEVNSTGWGLSDVNSVGWAQAMRAATTMCYDRGFAGGHFDGHQGELNGNQGFGIQCSAGDTQFYDVTGDAIAATGWGFTDVNAVPWGQANRAAERLCAALGAGFAGGHFDGHQRDGLYGLFCYRQGAQWFDATDADIAATGWGFATDDIDAVPWSQAARAAVGFCRARGFSGGFFNGQHVPGLYGVVCQS